MENSKTVVICQRCFRKETGHHGYALHLYTILQVGQKTHQTTSGTTTLFLHIFSQGHLDGDVCLVGVSFAINSAIFLPVP